MDPFCQDRDLLAIEPMVFLSDADVGQQLVVATDGAISQATLTSTSSDFVAAGVSAGMVLVVYAATPADGAAYEIVSVDSATTLTLSVLRAQREGTSIAPPAGTELSFVIRSFAALTVDLSATLAEKLRHLAESAGIASADFADSSQLSLTMAYGVLASLFVARAEQASSTDANWAKALHYRERYEASQLALRLAVDIDGNGLAEQTRTLGTIQLRRL
jgi:hypothetical protein